MEHKQTYGELQEDLHIAGYTFERACGRLRKLLSDGGWKECGPGFVDVREFLGSLQLDQFRENAEERKEIAKLIKELRPEVSQQEIAAAVGVSQRQISRDLRQDVLKKDENINEINKTARQDVSLTGAQAAREVAKQERKNAAAEETRIRRAASRGAEPLEDGMELRIGDCRRQLADVPDNSVPLILTDPPYGDDAESLFEWLAEFATRVLIPGGSLVCYTGQAVLDRDMEILSERLRYWWLLAMTHDQSQRLPGKFVIANFKPVLWYVKGHRRGRSLMPDVLKSPQREKDNHPWGQGEAGVWQIIEHLTDPGELIVDPFAGTATWGRIAARMGRRWLGADIEPGGSTSIEAAE